MKGKIFISFLTFVFCILSTAFALANWELDITAEGKNTGGMFKSIVTIGVSSEMSTIPAPPPPPSDNNSCKMHIPSSDWMSKYAKYIQSEDNIEHIWIISVIRGAKIGQDPDSATLTWDSSKIGNGSLEMHSGWNGEGEVIVSDMKTVSSYVINGNEANQYFTIHYKE